MGLGKTTQNLSRCRAGLTNLWHACPKRHAVRFPWHEAFICPPPFFYFLLPGQRLYTVKNMCIYTQIWLRRECIWITVATKQYCEWNIFTKVGRDAKCWEDICHWGAGLKVTVRIRDIAQNVLQSSLQTWSSYLHIFFLIAFLKVAFIRNIIIILCINYIITIRIYDNNAVVTNTHGRLQDLILLFKIPLGTRKNMFEISRQFGHAPSNSFASPRIGDPVSRLEPETSITFFLFHYPDILACK